MLAQLDPDEYRSLIRELAAEVRLAVDLSSLTAESVAMGGAGGGGSDARPGTAPASSPTTRSLVDHDELRMRGILK
jgi:hypothetical protein